jgi:TonB family protein
MNTSQTAGPKVRPIRFQPVLPQPAHPGRSLLGWGLPALLLESLAVVGIVAITSNADPVEPESVTMVQIVEVPDEVALPEAPPPPELPRAAAPAPTESVPAVVGFQELAMPTVVLREIPPPVLGTPTLDAADFTGEGVPGGHGLVVTEPGPEPVEFVPAFTPYTVAPFLRNGDAVTRTLTREYPAQLRSAGIGGRVLLWLYIDDAGKVQDSQVKTSSGFDAFDQAAMRVAMTMQFSPALNRDRKVPVWVAIPVDFIVQ